ncbi:hypothetical protein TWF970_011398 [Orbilia oligospora]|uniref:Uncharacterized protein n=1 Tax=Orbilia oligospora TaxID=2813651 RepID=A0A7C8VJA5_ORBOL|nr:hypothetical protein TWF970_011398 [Orbilia oligospora]
MEASKNMRQIGVAFDRTFEESFTNRHILERTLVEAFCGELINGSDRIVLESTNWISPTNLCDTTLAD